MSSARTSTPPSVRQALSRIAEANGDLNAFLTVIETRAEGISLAVKDLFDTAGIETTYGSQIYRGHVPKRSAEAVQRLEAAGYVVVGKTNLDEFAYGVTSENPHFGAVRNPLDPERSAGGSSGGSGAALAAGMCDVALGTDTGGSIRIPAACCGVVGFKPTYGAVSMHGIFPLSPSFDHAGPMARTAGECADAFAALAGRPVDRELDLASLRIGVAESYFDPCAPGVEGAVRGALELVPDAKALDFPPPDEFDNTPMFFAECSAVHRKTFPSRASEYGEDAAGRLRRGLQIKAVDYLACREERSGYRAACLRALEGFDLLVTPTMPIVAPWLRAANVELGGLSWTTRDLVSRNTRPFNSLGWPVVAVPCAPAEDGLPASLSLAGRPGEDALVLGAAMALEKRLRSAGVGSAR
jgi:aspartyl-tRNA(Asn)/glutamyl-tRNA(Gln) amidotransferase subunit A